MGEEAQNITVQIEVPARLYAELEALVNGGFARDLDGLVLEALKRYSESQSRALTDELAREDLEWGLRGKD